MGGGGGGGEGRESRGAGGGEEDSSGFLDASTGAEAGVCLGSCSPKCGR